MSTAKQPVRVGLIGVGKMGQNHLRVLSLLKDVDLRFIYDADKRVADRLGAGQKRVMVGFHCRNRGRCSCVCSRSSWRRASWATDCRRESSP